MKCIYCNSEVELTSSDIITYAITGAKLTKSLGCLAHTSASRKVSPSAVPAQSRQGQVSHRVGYFSFNKITS